MTDANKDRLRTILPGIILALVTAALIMAKTGRDALFFQGKGLFQLPLAYMTIGMMSLPVALIFVKVMKVWGARPARVGLLTLAGVIMISYVPFLRPEAYPLLLSLFIFIPTIFGIMFASLWLLASDIFDKTPKSESARSFSRIGAGSLAGGMIGGLLSKTLAPHLDPKWLILLAAGAILVVVGLVIKTHQIFPTNIGVKKNEGGEDKTSFSKSFSKRYTRTLLLISMTGALAGLLIDFQFYATASMAQMGSRGITNFFANFYIMLNLGSLLIQLFATPWIQSKIGLRGALMILPLALVGGATFVTAAATAVSRSVLRVTEGGLRSSIHRVTWEQSFIPVDPPERSYVKVVVDGMGARIAEGIGAGALFLWLMRVAPNEMVSGSLNLTWIAWLTLATVSAWLIISNDLRLQAKREAQAQAAVPPRPAAAPECERFADQCPCTTEWGKGVK